MEENFSAPQFTIGSILSRTCTTLFSNPVVFFSMPLIALMPVAFVKFYFQPTQGGVFNPIAIFTLGLVALLAGILSMLIQGAFPYAVYQALRGNTATVGESLSYCMPKLGTLFIASSLVSLGIGFGLLLFVIPGLIWACKWDVTVQACVVENLTARESMKRSTELTENYRMKIFFLIFISFAGSQLIEKLATTIGALIFPHGSIAIVFLTYLVLVLPTAFNNVMATVIYYDLRVIKEGTALDALANVFD